MKFVFAFLLITLYSFSTNAQETTPAFDGHKWEPPYQLAIPNGFTIERFLIPMSFALQIKYKGVEDIRFTPGWGNVKSDEYWSYAFLWYLDGKQAMSASIIQKNLKAYYTGLFNVNTDSAKRKIVPIKDQQVTTTFKAIKPYKGDMQTYKGSIVMPDYMQLKPITLNCIIHVKPCTQENKTIVFYELSPQPFSHTVFKSFNVLWQGFSCKKK